jgi:hypothetical protein
MKKKMVISLMVIVSVLALIQSHAQAVTISLDNVTLGTQGISSLTKGQQLENALNQLVFNPLGIELEVAAITGGTTAVDDFSIEGPGLTIIGGSGFILRFLNNDVQQVRVRFGDFKDGGGRSLYAFDPQIDYTRSTTNFSQSANGNVTGFTEPVGSALNSVSGTVPVDLIVSDSLGRISSIWGDTNFFLTSLEEIEVVSSSSTPIPEPGTFILLLIGIGGVSGYGYFRTHRKTA